MYKFFLLFLFFTLLHTVSSGQVIFGGNMYFERMSISQTENEIVEITYRVDIFLYISCGSKNEFRYKGIDEHKLTIYHGESENDAVLIEERQIGGANSAVTTIENEVMFTSYNCFSPPSSSECVEKIGIFETLTLPAITGNYYFVYEGGYRDNTVTNVTIDDLPNNKMILSTFARIDQNNNTAYSTGRIIGTNSLGICTKDTTVIDLKVFEGNLLQSLPIIREYKLYTPRTNWDSKENLIYQDGYSADKPFGEHYYQFDSSGNLETYVTEAGKYIVGICVIFKNENTDLKYAQTCQELTLQFYDCEPKVLAALAGAEQNDQGIYLLGSCETQIPLSGQNAGSLSGGAFQWNFQDEDGENYPAFQRNPVFEFPSFGTYIGQLNVEAEGCRDSVQIEINIGAAPESGLEEVYEVCDLPLVLEGNEEVNFLWEDGSTSAQREILQSGTYQLTVSDNCERSQNILVRNLSEEIPEYGLIETEDTTICLQNGYTLALNRNDVSNVTWNGVPKTSLEVQESGLYRVFATTTQGCELYDEIEIEVIDCTGKIYVPNAFSPNGDGVNDRFEISASQAEIKSLRIFDRWGNLVHEGITPWDGEVRQIQVVEGIYVYQLEYFEPLLERMQQLSGELVLMR